MWIENGKDNNIVVTFPKLGKFNANNLRYVCNAQQLCEWDNNILGQQIKTQRKLTKV